MIRARPPQGQSRSFSRAQFILQPLVPQLGYLRAWSWAWSCHHGRCHVNAMCLPDTAQRSCIICCIKTRCITCIKACDTAIQATRIVTPPLCRIQRIQHIQLYSYTTRYTIQPIQHPSGPSIVPARLFLIGYGRRWTVSSTGLHVGLLWK